MVDGFDRNVDVLNQTVDALPGNVDALEQTVDAWPREVDALDKTVAASPRTVDAIDRTVDMDEPVDASPRMRARLPPPHLRRYPSPMRKYLQQPVGRRELRSLIGLAEAEERSFFDRNPHLIRPYRRRLLAAALCQGAALQYLRCGYGVKDFDVHFFYAQNPSKPRLSRAVKRIFATVGGFDGVAVDFIRTVVPVDGSRRSVAERIRVFLEERPTANAVHLARKGVVGLLPKTVFAQVLWRPTAVLSSS